MLVKENYWDGPEPFKRFWASAYTESARKICDRYNLNFTGTEMEDFLYYLWKSALPEIFDEVKQVDRDVPAISKGKRKVVFRDVDTLIDESALDAEQQADLRLALYGVIENAIKEAFVATHPTESGSDIFFSLLDSKTIEQVEADRERKAEECRKECERIAAEDRREVFTMVAVVLPVAVAAIFLVFQSCRTPSSADPTAGSKSPSAKLANNDKER